MTLKEYESLLKQNMSIEPKYNFGEVVWAFSPFDRVAKYMVVNMYMTPHNIEYYIADYDLYNRGTQLIVSVCESDLYATKEECKKAIDEKIMKANEQCELEN